MYIKEFEQELRKISPKLNIKRTAQDIAGIYYGDEYLNISTAPEFVFDNVNVNYRDNPPWWTGQKERVIYRSRPLLTKLIKFKLQHYVNTNK
jgi:hypothetical protein